MEVIEEIPVKKKRGRPPKNKVEAKVEAVEEIPVKKKRGRPPKNKVETKVEVVEQTPVKRKRGRPPKNKQEFTVAEKVEVIDKNIKSKKNKNGKHANKKQDVLIPLFDEVITIDSSSRKKSKKRKTIA